MKPRHIEILRLRTAELAVGASTVRGSPPGTVAAARHALKLVKLSDFAVSSRSDFQVILERETDRIRTRLPTGARHWGIARKVLNIFLRSCTYSRPLAEAYGLSAIERWLELPLDKQVALGIRTCSGANLTHWHTVKDLSKEVSRTYQTAAASLARRVDVYPIHLEACWWRETVHRCKCAV